MKTILLSADDIQNFSKLIYEHKSADPTATAALISGSGSGINGGTGSTNLIGFQYYLKHPHTTNYGDATSAAHVQRPQAQQHQQQQQLVDSQTQLKQLQLKQPTLHHHNSSYHHHPYYQSQPAAAPIATTHVVAAAHSHNNNSHNFHATTAAAPLPVHALNQNSNFSAASSSTGGGTASSHAPTQQSNTTGSSLSPPGATASARTSNASGATTAHAVTVRTSISSATKRLKTEPLLSQFHQTERLSFAQAHIVWSEAHWKRVIFQDERKFNLDGPDGFSYYFHDLRNYERTLSQRPRGNSVYVYVILSAGGPIHLDVSTARRRPEACIETLLRERPNIISKLGSSASDGGDFVLQDHNWSATASLPTAQEWLSAEGIKTQKWPTIAHDLNIMENVWGWLIREVFDGGRKFSRKDDLIFRIREAWARLPIDLLANLYSTLPERITELYYTRGVYTNC